VRGSYTRYTPYAPLEATMRSCVVALLVLLLVGCADQQEIVAPQSAEEQAQMFLQSPEFARLIEIREEITEHVATRGVSTQQLAAAYEQGDLRLAESLVGLSARRSEEYNQELNRIRSRVLSDYPALASVGTEIVSLDGCGPVLDWATTTEPSFSRLMQLQTMDYSCKWLQYTAALILCTAAGPGWYWPCAYLAWCAFCNGALIDYACYLF
jgi:hypothetical protein